MKDINTIMNNPNNAYYGHGTLGDSLILDSILKNGLRCSHGNMYYTTCSLGIGTLIDKDIEEMLKNWPHNSCKKIVIVSLPIKYHILDSPGIGTYDEAYSAYYYVPSLDLQKEKSLTNSNYVMPEFIFGYYDVSLDSFVKNPRYYEFLPLEEQDKLFARVKENYVNIIDNVCGLSVYKEIIDSLPNWEFPLSDDEIIHK